MDGPHVPQCVMIMKGGYRSSLAHAVARLSTRPETAESRVRPQPYSPCRIPMKMRSILGALVIASLSAMPALAVEMTPEEIKKLVDDAVNKKMQEHERHEGEADLWIG